MAKKNGNSSSGTALAPPPPAQRSNLPTTQGNQSRLEGADPNDFVLQRVHIFQGLPPEVKQYGKGFEPGDLINQLTNQKLPTNTFMPLFGFKQYIRWKEPRGSGLEYNYREKRQVPPADLEWSGDTPPIAQEYINWVVIFAGEDSPCILSFTSTSLNAGRTINTLEVMRAKGNKSPGAYRIEMQDKSNNKGAWKSPRISPVGDPDPALAEMAKVWFDTLNPVKVAEQTEPEEGFNPNKD
jgi:hypothetical protein